MLKNVLMTPSVFFRFHPNMALLPDLPGLEAAIHGLPHLPLRELEQWREK